MMADAEVVEGTKLEAELDRLFLDTRVDFVHMHNARPGCFAVRVARADPVASPRDRDRSEVCALTQSVSPTAQDIHHVLTLGIGCVQPREHPSGA